MCDWENKEQTNKVIKVDLVCTHMRSGEQRRVGEGGGAARRHLQAALGWSGAGGGGGAGQAWRGVDGALAALRVAAVGTGRSGRHLQRLQT